MRKSYVILAAVAGMAIASCTTNDYVGEAVPQKANTDAISFGSGANALVRADIDGSEAATLLGNAMKVYGVKQDADDATKYNKVFVDYSVKYETGKVGNEEYNKGWYYVGADAAGTQSIKYWDYASDDYHFVAGSPVDKFTYALDATTGDIATATVTGLGGRLDHADAVTVTPVYIADPVVVAKDYYKQPVKFTFRSILAKVRVGVYETVDGYSITDIKFYNNAATPVASKYVTLNSATDDYFQGGDATGTVTYDWTTPSYTFAYSGSGLKKGKFWEGGEFTGVPAVSSNDNTNLWGAGAGTNGWFAVMPTPSATTKAPLTIKCDFTLTATDGSGETINVKGATATIPDAYTKWAPNTTYTYVFKITRNTNGKTDPDQPDEGLYPITFDAVVVNTADVNQQVGTETTVSTPSITVYQEGNVVEAGGITFKAGDITVKVMEGTAEATTTSTGYVVLNSYDYTQDYEKLGASGAATAWTDGFPATVDAGKTYILKAVTANGTAYFVLVVAAE